VLEVKYGKCHYAQDSQCASCSGGGGKQPCQEPALSVTEIECRNNSQEEDRFRVTSAEIERKWVCTYEDNSPGSHLVIISGPDVLIKKKASQQEGGIGNDYSCKVRVAQERAYGTHYQRIQRPECDILLPCVYFRSIPIASVGDIHVPTGIPSAPTVQKFIFRKSPPNAIARLDGNKYHAQINKDEKPYPRDYYNPKRHQEVFETRPAYCLGVFTGDVDAPAAANGFSRDITVTPSYRQTSGGFRLNLPSDTASKRLHDSRRLASSCTRHEWEISPHRLQGFDETVGPTVAPYPEISRTTWQNLLFRPTRFRLSTSTSITSTLFPSQCATRAESASPDSDSSGTILSKGRPLFLSKI
jgi:hypothetical protein